MNDFAMSSKTMNGTALQPIPIDIVSIQSQVVYGHVGNNAAWPTLQAHGLNVAAVPTVMFSNTPHCPTVHGGALPTEWFEGYLHDLVSRGALRQLRAILVGYLGNTEQMACLSRWLDQIQAERPEVLLIVDPVIGDDDHGIYVAAGMPQAYRELLLPKAHGLTPNGFELQQLSRRPVDRVEQVIAAARSLLSDRLQWLAVTSAAPETCTHDEMQIVVVTHDGDQVFRHPRIAASPKGTGDLFSAKLTALRLESVPLLEAVAGACNHVIAALQRSHQARCAELLLPRPSHAVHKD